MKKNIIIKIVLTLWILQLNLLTHVSASNNINAWYEKENLNLKIERRIDKDKKTKDSKITKRFLKKQIQKRRKIHKWLLQLYNDWFDHKYLEQLHSNSIKIEYLKKELESFKQLRA